MAKRAGRTSVSIEDSIHEKMKMLAKVKNKNISDLYREVLTNYIAAGMQEMILADSKLLQQLNERITKGENRLASMLARAGMDTSIVLMGLMTFLPKATGKERDELYELLRKQAAEYFSKPARSSNNN